MIVKGKNMNYVKITSPDINNGNGNRVTIWFSGCKHNCKGCHNAWLQDYKQGKEFSQEAVNEVYRQVSKPYMRGITLSGGDPLYQSEESLMYLSNFVKKFKDDFPDKDIWLYTGFTIPDIFDKDDMLSVYRQMVLEYVDYVVDGKFEIAKKDCGLAFRGSSNQNIWKLPERVIVKDEVFQN